jgi:hypothetical protein
MSIKVTVGQQNYALALTWMPIQNGKQASMETLYHRGEASVIRKYKQPYDKDKGLQLGIVTGNDVGESIVAADMIANWKPASSIIYLMSVTHEDDSISYWGVASINGQILLGSDVLLSPMAELEQWLFNFTELYSFEIYADSSIAEELSKVKIEFQIQDLSDIPRQYGKLRTGKSKSKNTPIPVVPLVLVAALAGGGFYFYQARQSDTQTIELTSEQKQAIVNDLLRKEKDLTLKELAADDYIAAQHYLSATLDYPTSVVSWDLASKTIDIPGRVAVMQWVMRNGGFMSQLEAVRPGAQIIIDNSLTSGQLATETISTGMSKHNSSQGLDAIMSGLTINKFLIELAQRLKVQVKTMAGAPVLTELPPPNSGVVFTPTYQKSKFTFTGKDFASLLLTLDGLSLAPNMKPLAITTVFTNSVVSGWTLESVAYSKNH